MILPEFFSYSDFSMLFCGSLPFLNISLFLILQNFFLIFRSALISDFSPYFFSLSVLLIFWFYQKFLLFWFSMLFWGLFRCCPFLFIFLIFQNFFWFFFWFYFLRFYGSPRISVHFTLQNITQKSFLLFLRCDMSLSALIFQRQSFQKMLNLVDYELWGNVF